MKLLRILSRLLIFVMLWISVTTLIQAYKCTKLTQTELFYRIPDSIILDFEVCE